MKTVGIAYNDLIPEALDLAHAIVGELNLGSDTWILRAEDAEDLNLRAQDTDLVITIGGDGTILRVNRAIAPRGIPLLGINMGRLGRGDIGDGHGQHRVQLRRRRANRGPAVRRRGVDSVGVARGVDDLAGAAAHQQRRFRLEGSQEAIISVDGFENHPIEPGDWVRVTRSPYRARFLRANDHNYFWATLTRRLGFSLTGR